MTNNAQIFTLRGLWGPPSDVGPIKVDIIGFRSEKIWTPQKLEKPHFLTFPPSLYPPWLHPATRNSRHAILPSWAIIWTYYHIILGFVTVKIFWPYLRITLNTWQQAMQFCENMGKGLVKWDTADSYLDLKHLSDQGAFWTALTNTNGEDCDGASACNGLLVKFAILAPK